MEKGAQKTTKGRYKPNPHLVLPRIFVFKKENKIRKTVHENSIAKQKRCFLFFVEQFNEAIRPNTNQSLVTFSKEAAGSGKVKGKVKTKFSAC